MRTIIAIEVEIPDTPVGHNIFRSLGLAVSKTCKNYPDIVQRVLLNGEPVSIEVIKMLEKDAILRRMNK